MRSHHLPSTLLMAILLSGVSVDAREIRDAMTSEQLQKQFQKASLNNPFSQVETKNLEIKTDPTKANQPEDLIATSDFLSFQGLSTLIPKRAILHVPKTYRDRIQFVKGSRIVVWPDFFVPNRGWIKTQEVTREQAMGIEPFDEKVAESIEKSSQVIVATYKGGPISVLPPKKPEEENENPEATNSPQP